MARSIALIFGILVLAGCATAPLRGAAAKKPAEAVQTREATVLFAAPGTLSATPAGYACQPVSGESGGAAPLLTPLINIGVDAVIGAVSNHLEKAKAARTASWSASGTAELQPGMYCLALTRGVLTQAAGQDPAFDGLPSKLNISGNPIFVLYANMEVRLGKNEYLVKVSPQYLGYADTSAPSRGSGSKDVSLVLNFASNGTAAAESGGGAEPKKAAPKAKDEDKPAAKTAEQPKSATAGSLTLAFGKLKVGASYDAALLSPISAATVVPISPLYSTSALVTESEDPSVALSVFAASFEKNKDSLATALKDALAPEDKKDSK